MGTPHINFNQPTTPNYGNNEDNNQKRTTFIVSVAIVALLCICLYLLVSKNNNHKIVNGIDDIQKVEELSRNYNLRTSTIHLSAAVRLCRSGDQRACQLLSSLIGKYPWLQLHTPDYPINKTIKDLKSADIISVSLLSVFRRDHKGIGPIKDFNQIYGLGRNLFQNWVIRGMITAPTFEEIQWLLLIHGYSMDGWAKNGPKVLEDEPIEQLNLNDWMNKVLRGNGFKTVQDVMKFIRRGGDLWEQKLSELIKNPNVIGPLKEALVKVGYGPEILPLSRQ